MSTVELSDSRLRELVEYQDKLSFGDKRNRDRAYKMIPEDERGNWKRSSIRGQAVSPHYVSDAYDTTDYGLGNELQMWSVLYNLERAKWWG